MSNNTRYVAHIDILGMRALVQRDADKAWELLSGLVQARNEALNREAVFDDGAEILRIPDQLKAVMFSDTILLYTQSDTRNDLHAVLIATTDILSEALKLEVPLRAGIALGTFFVNSTESMYSGPAVIDAYDVGESAQWIGIVATKAVYDTSQHLKSGTHSAVVKYAVPTRCGAIPGYAVNWPVILRKSFKKDPPFSDRDIYEGFDEFFGSFDDLSLDVQRKYQNTAEFINAMTIHERQSS